MIRILIAGGDCMLGRAVQLTLPAQTPGEELIKDSCTAQHYLNLCLNHPSATATPTDTPDLHQIRKLNAHRAGYLWGDYHGMSISPPPDLKLLNLETAVTSTIDNPDVPVLWKAIRYHMHVDNFETAVLDGFQAETHGSHAAPLVMSCANNHILDYGHTAFDQETWPLLLQRQREKERFQTVGCGRDFKEASRPANVSLKNDKTVQVFGFAAGCAGTPTEWWATDRRSGLLGLPALVSRNSVQDAMAIAKQVLQQQPPSPQTTKETIRIVSIHWGPNWAMRGETESHLAARRELAHRLVDECGVDMVYGHSSHHARGMEVYHGKLILYGTGDIINDYEGFENVGEEKYNRLGGLYVVDLAVDGLSKVGNFVQLRIVPMYMDRLSLRRHTTSSAMWHPNERHTIAVPEKSREFAAFLNDMSRMDAKENALLVDYCENDPQVPGGPILRSSPR